MNEHELLPVPRHLLAELYVRIPDERLAAMVREILRTAEQNKEQNR